MQRHCNRLKGALKSNRISYLYLGVSIYRMGLSLYSLEACKFSLFGMSGGGPFDVFFRYDEHFISFLCK